MRTVVVDGVTLTEAQVNEAYKELQEPAVKNLTEVKNKKDGKKGIVIIGHVQRYYIEGYKAVEAWHPLGSLTVVAQGGMGYTYPTSEELLGVWSVVER